MLQTTLVVGRARGSEPVGTGLAAVEPAASSNDDVMSDRVEPIRAAVIEALRASTRNAVALSDRTNIVRELGLDSIAIMDFVMELEDRLDVSVPLDRIAEVETIGDLVATLRDLTSQD